MKKRLIIFLILLCILIGAGIYFSKASHAPNFSSGLGFIQSLAEQLPKQENLPEPLQKLQSTATGRKTENLNSKTIIQLTNAERKKEGKVTLKENVLLNKAAESKIDDMFSQQYFEHVSPTGKGPADIIEKTGYGYIVVGENLAEGAFESNAELIAGWMNSPGHRENILNSKYREIGVAVRQGIYKGAKVWMAVQEFGRPLKDCPEIDVQLKATITENEMQIHLRQDQLQAMNIEMADAQARGDATTYNAMVPKYNEFVAQINQLIEQTKALVVTYNAQVQDFNACIK